jgi:hypothetical protein
MRGKPGSEDGAEEEEGEDQKAGEGETLMRGALEQGTA